MSGGLSKNDRVHETAEQIDASKEDGHDGDKFRDGSIHGMLEICFFIWLREYTEETD